MTQPHYLTPFKCCRPACTSTASRTIRKKTVHLHHNGFCRHTNDIETDIRHRSNDVGLSTLLAGFISSISMICIRKIHEKDSSWVIALYFTIFTAIASAPMAIATYIPPTPTEWALLGFVGFMISLAQIFLTKAYKLGEAATIAPFNYTFVIGSYITGLLIFSEIPDAISVRTCVIVGSGMAIMLTAPKRQSPPGATPATRI